MKKSERMKLAQLAVLQAGYEAEVTREILLDLIAEENSARWSEEYRAKEEAKNGESVSN